MRILIQLLVLAIAVMISSWLLPGVMVNNYLSAIGVALILALLNTFIKPLLILITLPVTILTFGIFLLVINAGLILLASDMIDGFYVDGFWWALLFSLILSLISALLGINTNLLKNRR